MDTYLIVVFGKEFSLIVCNDLPENTFAFENKRFVDTGIDTFVGFYDWLRTEQKNVIGVRIDFFSDEFESLKSELLKLSYVSHSDESEAIDIFFLRNNKIDLDKSDDQDFLDNKIYKSYDGTYAISFDSRYAIESLRDNKQIILISLE